VKWRNSQLPGRKGHGEVHHHQERARAQLQGLRLALQQLASHRFPLEKVTTHTFGLKDVDLAIRSVGGHGVPDVIHASLMPWQ
jgi:hypothetical protein